MTRVRVILSSCLNKTQASTNVMRGLTETIGLITTTSPRSKANAKAMMAQPEPKPDSAKKAALRRALITVLGRVRPTKGRNIMVPKEKAMVAKTRGGML